IVLTIDEPTFIKQLQADELMKQFAIIHFSIRRIKQDQIESQSSFRNSIYPSHRFSAKHFSMLLDLKRLQIVPNCMYRFWVFINKNTFCHSPTNGFNA